MFKTGLCPVLNIPFPLPKIEREREMLDTVDLSSKMEKDVYKPLMADLSDRLYYVQQASWAAGVPVIILFEGWDAAGKGTTIHKLTDPIDPRGYKIYPIRAVRTYEKKHPWLWRFWLKIPARGEWAIFDRSWYGRVLVERMENLVEEKDWKRSYRDIVDFERTLADDGTLILKFFLHISKKEQKKRFKKLTDDPLNAWRVSEEDLRNHKRYKKWLRIYQEMLEQTDTEWGPWTIVEATDRRHTQVKVYETIIHALESRLGISAQPMLVMTKHAEQNGSAVQNEEAGDAASLQAETTAQKEGG
jgi:AMP-polyphosphate phosphotransferase